MRTTSGVIKVLAASIAVLLTAQAAVLATTTRRNGGPVTAVRSVTADDNATNETLSYATVPGMSVTVGVPDGEEAHLVITFSGVSYCVDNDEINSAFCLVKVVVDGDVAAPGPVRFDTAPDGGGYEANSMQFVTGPLPPGSYNVSVKFRITESGTFTLGPRTLTVLRSRV